MAISLTQEQTRLLRIEAQQLASRRSGGEDSPAKVAQIVRDLCGVQAQDVSAASLAVRARCQGLTKEDFDRALFKDRSVVRTWLMRGTLHLIAAEDLDWVLTLLAPRFIRANRGRRKELGLDEETGAKGVRAISELLSEGGPLTRKEIATQLDKQGIPTAGQAIIHLIGLAALQRILCYGPDREGQETFVLLKDWVDQGRTLPDEQAQVELAHRYLAAYGPAAPEDFAAWSGLTLRAAHSAWEKLADQLLELELDGEPLWILEEQEDRLNQSLSEEVTINLLPKFDPYLLGYRSRNLSVPQTYAKRIHPGGGMLRPALLVDGLAAGTWTLKRKKNDLAVIIEPFEELGDETLFTLESEVEEVGRYYAMHATLEITRVRNS